VQRDAHEGMVCGHCGFDARGTGAFYCPKCGMKLGGAG
jgi:ribosomal protein L37AE/L43A